LTTKIADSIAKNILLWTGLPHHGKVLDFFFAVLEKKVLESPEILFVSPGKFLKISGRFPMLHQDRIVKLLSVIISSKS